MNMQENPNSEDQGEGRREREHSLVQVQAGNATLEGDLSIPDGATGIVAFVHGSGSSRNSPRNQYVASELQAGGLATLLFDLLTAEEDEIDRVTRQYRFNIDLLAKRTEDAVVWLLEQPNVYGMRLGLFGASTGAAAALITAAQLPGMVQAVVSRGGRPDLAGAYLGRVQAPTLLIVGGLDDVVIDLNKQALAQMQPDPPKDLVIVPGATHLFEEAGTLERAAQLARDWFKQYLLLT